MNGIIVVDKKKGNTSFDEIREIRKKYNTKKVGHIGTLDPMATGVLPILIGEATKLSDYLMGHDKEYVATLKLGQKMDTGDSEGSIVLEKPIPILSEEKIKEVLSSFLGKSNQIPPMYSAIKINGKKLYELAREGKEIEREAREIEIYAIELIKIKEEDNIVKEIEFKVNCSKGTYIRVLCEDIAKKLGTCGYMSELRRTRVGNFTLKDTNKLLTIEEVMKDKDTYSLKENELKKLLNGVKIQTVLKDGLVRIYNNHDFIGIGEVKNNIFYDEISNEENGIAKDICTTLKEKEILLDNDLINEGIAREVISKVQQMRKNIDLELTDRIIIKYNSSEPIKEAILEFIDYIKRETLATDIIFDETVLDEFNINDEIIKIAIIKK